MLHATLACPAVAAAAPQVPDTVIANAKARVDEGWIPGLVIGVVDSARPRFFSYGVTARNGEPVSERTIFEIGSVTKVVTALLLAEMAVRGVVSLDQPVQSLLPDRVRMPRYGERQATLRHLALHLSGLPPEPPDGGGNDPANSVAAPMRLGRTVE